MTDEEKDSIVTVSSDVTEAEKDSVSRNDDSTGTAKESASDNDSDENLEASDASENEETEIENESDSKEDDESEESLDGKKPGKGWKRRLRKLNSRVSEAKKEAEYWKKVALEKENAKKPIETDGSAKNAAADTSDKPNKPNKDDFATYEEYENAKDKYYEDLADWKADQKLKSFQTKQKQTEVKTEHQKQVESFFKKSRESYDDFDDVLEDVADVPLSAAVEEIIFTSENGHELFYELAKNNREEFERINKLSPIVAARELGKFETSIVKSQDLKPKPKTTTKAPSPLKTVGASQGKVKRSLYDAENMTQAEFERVYEETFKQMR